jgi:glyoxylase-like metal-dependent hydrolase (beta-lactamase superfamily II)
MDFVFASTIGQLGLNRTNETLDGDVAYNIGGGFLAPQSGTPQPQPAGPATARQRRVELLAHPITIVRAALESTSKLSNLRKQGTLQLVDVTIRQGDTLTLAVNAASNLPAWVSYVGPHANLGDVAYRTAFAGYVPEKGVQLPTGFATTIDFRSVVQSKLYVDRNIVDGPIDDLSAPASVRAAPTTQGAPGGGGANLKPVKIADHVWYMNGNTFLEFDDHITMVEANRPDAALQAILAVVNALVPGKRVTQVIQSHHHFDHSVGLRAAVAQGLTVISRRGNEGIFREMVARPAKLFPDALGRNPKPLKFMPVDDHLKLKDSTNEIDIYHIVGNYHMADGVIVHVPASNLLVEADLTTQDWDYNWWGDSLMNNIEYRKIKVDTNLAVHAQKPFPLAEVVSAIERQVRNAQAFCRRAAEAQFFQPGCPIQYNRPLPPVSK